VLAYHLGLIHFNLPIFLSSLASVLQKLFRIPPSYPCVARVSITIIGEDVHPGVGPRLADGRLLGHPVPITMSAFGSQLIQIAVARVDINIIGYDVQLGVGYELADGRLLGHPHRALLVLVRTRRIC
jgi:hypothetical protein